MSMTYTQVGGGGASGGIPLTGVWLLSGEGEMFVFMQEILALRAALTHQPCKVSFVKFGEAFWR